MLDFRYFLIDVHRYNEEELSWLSNLIGVVFSLDQVEGMSEWYRRQISIFILSQPYGCTESDDHLRVQ